MRYLAFDVSKDKIDGVFTNLRNKYQYFSCANNKTSIKNLILKNLDLKAKTTKRNIIAGCESTGNYHLILQKLMLKMGFNFKIINPILTKQFTKTTIRKKKTDKSDSLIIAKLLSQGEGTKTDLKWFDSDFKTFTRTSEKLIQIQTKLKLMLHHLKLHQNRLPKMENCLKQLIKYQQPIINKQKQILKNKYKDDKNVKLLQSLVGIGPKTSLGIAAEIIDIDRFPNSKSLVAFSGYDPKIKQSGHSLNSQGRLTKRGSPYLRLYIHQAANVARQHDPELKQYYQKKRNEGKKYTTAMCAVSRKLIYRIYAVLKRRTPYVVKKRDLT